MNKIISFIITLMIIFTGGCVGSAIRDYSRYKADKPIYDNMGADWNDAVTTALTHDLIWWAAIMLILTAALVGCVICTIIKARKEKSK